MANKYPEASEIILNDIYVDDCVSGISTKGDLLPVTDDLKSVLENRGFYAQRVHLFREGPR